MNTHLASWLSGSLYYVLTRPSYVNFQPHRTKMWMMILLVYTGTTKLPCTIQVGKVFPISLSGWALYLFGFIQHSVTLVDPSFPYLLPAHLRCNPFVGFCHHHCCLKQPPQDTIIRRRIHRYVSLKGGFVASLRTSWNVNYSRNILWMDRYGD
jgi:hypothetical protein